MEEQKRAWEEELRMRRSVARKREEMKKWFEERRLRDSDLQVLQSLRPLVLHLSLRSDVDVYSSPIV